ncbi:MAG: hypothetical protein Q6L68_13400 [Thermostichus sp. DG02_5_bins_236]
MIKIDDLTGQEIVDFLNQHIQEMQSVSPPESKHALDIKDLRRPDITFWTVWDAETLAGVEPLKNWIPGRVKLNRCVLAFPIAEKGSLLCCFAT